MSIVSSFVDSISHNAGMDKFFFEFPESVDGKEIPQMIRRHERGGSDSRSQVSGISSSNTILSSLSNNKSMLSQNKSMLSNAGKSVL